MPKLKKNITGAKPSEVADMLLIYKDEVEIPIWGFAAVMKCMPVKETNLFAIAVRGEKVIISHAETIQSTNK